MMPTRRAPFRALLRPPPTGVDATGTKARYHWCVIAVPRNIPRLGPFRRSECRMATTLLAARLALAGVFLMAGLAKLADRTGSRQAISNFGLPQRLARPLSLALPLVELAVSIALIPPASARWGALGALALLLIFVLAIAVNLAKGRKPDCHCFGQLHSSPVGWPTLARNAALAGVAGLVLWQGWADPGPNPVSWMGDLSAGATAVVIGGAVMVAVVGLQTWALLHLVRQHGQLLLRLDALESTANTGTRGSRPAALGGSVPGLPVGTQAPDFMLSDIHGETLTLATLLSSGKPVLLLFTASGCGPCEALMPEVGRWQRDHASSLTIALVTSGPRDTIAAIAREHNLANVLCQESNEVADRYGYIGTPGAVVVTSEGALASPVVGGADAVRLLVTQAVGRPGPEPVPLRRANGNGHASHQLPSPRLEVGQPAPHVRLPDLKGKTVDLVQFRGQEVLVLFWNPACGFCQKMLPDLKAWKIKTPASLPELLVISTGSVQENRAMELQATVLVDSSFSVASAFGATATPMAVLLDPEGNIASPVVAGADAVLNLAKGFHPRTRPAADRALGESG